MHLCVTQTDVACISVKVFLPCACMQLARHSPTANVNKWPVRHPMLASVLKSQPSARIVLRNKTSTQVSSVDVICRHYRNAGPRRTLLLSGSILQCAHSLPENGLLRERIELKATSKAAYGMSQPQLPSLRASNVPGLQDAQHSCKAAASSRTAKLRFRKTCTQHASGRISAVVPSHGTDKKKRDQVPSEHTREHLVTVS